MKFLRNLFSSGPERDERATYFYVKPHRCPDVMRLRVDLYNDLSLTDDDNGYWVRKLVSSSNYKCNQVELVLYFDKNRNLQESEIQGGQLVDRAAYDNWLETQPATAEE